MNKRIYLDHAATTQMSSQVLEYMLPYLKEEYGNPSSIYDLGSENKKALLLARKKIAAVLSCEPQNIYFTSGGTESDNWALVGVAESRAKQGKHLITTKMEHHAILETCHYLSGRGYEVTYLDVDELGMVHPEQLKRALRLDTILVSIMTANNEIGSIQPIARIGEILKNHPALFHTDAVQAFGQIPLTPRELGIDLLSASAHKFYGPKGIGFLYVGDGIKLPSFMHGGKQERGLRAGTENVAYIAGMGEAARLANETMKERNEKESMLRDYMIHRLEHEIPYCRLNGSRKNRLPGNVNMGFSFIDGETAVIMLDMEGVCCSSGSACSAGQSSASHVLKSIRLPEEFAKGSLRFTLGKDTSKEDVDTAVEKIKDVLEKARKMNPAYTKFQKINQKK